MDSRKPLTAGEIEELKALEAKATPGPWAWEFTGDDNTCAVGTVMDENDNFIAGMVGQDVDTVVVDSVCPEVTNQQDAAFIAASRNAIPRFLSMLTPHPDAAVRQAVEIFEKSMREQPWLREHYDNLEVLLRAVQTPLLTGDQVEAVAAHRDWLCENGFWDEVFDIEEVFPGLPERLGCMEPHEAGEVGRG